MKIKRPKHIEISDVKQTLKLYKEGLECATFCEDGDNMIFFQNVIEVLEHLVKGKNGFDELKSQIEAYLITGRDDFEFKDSEE